MTEIYNAALALLRQDIGYNDSESIKDKIDRVVTLAIDSVNSAYDWRNPFDKDSASTADAKVRGLVVYSLARELAIPVTGRNEDLKMIDAVYQQKLAEAKIADFEESVKEETDEFVTNVFSLAVASLASSAEKQVAMHSYANMKKRIEAGKSMAEEMIRAAHEWKDGDAHEIGDNLLAVATAMGVASTFGANENQVTLLTQRYQAELADAIAKDMDEEIDALRGSEDEGDRFASRVIDLLRLYNSDADGKYANGQPKPSPRGISRLVKHISNIKKSVRDELLHSHDWGFAKCEARPRSSIKAGDSRYSTQVPGDAVRIVKCFNTLDEKVETVMRDGVWIVSREPIDRIVYIRDVEDESEWTALALRAYERKVAAAVAMGDPALAANGQRIAQLIQLAEKSVQDARTADARQNHTGSSAYGRNHLFDVATGRKAASRW